MKGERYGYDIGRFLTDSPNLNPKDLSWIYHPVYEDAYRFDTSVFIYTYLHTMRSDRKLPPVKRYLSLGTGTGLCVVAIHNAIPDIEYIVTVDDSTKPHPSIHNLGIDVRHLDMPIQEALMFMGGERNKFDLIAFENVPTHGMNAVPQSGDLLHRILQPHGWVVAHGDCGIAAIGDRDDLFRTIPGPTGIINQILMKKS